MRVVSATALLTLTMAGCGGGGPAKTAIAIEKFAAVAVDERQVVNIWGKEQASAKTVAQATAAAREAPGLGYKTIEFTATRTAADVWLQQYRESSAGVVVLVGHNNNGQFRFADGSAVNLKTVGDQGGPPIALLSCDSDRFANGQSVGVIGDVSFPLAWDTERRFAEKLALKEVVPSNSDLQALLTASLDEAARAKKVKVYAAGGSIGSGVVVVSISVVRVQGT